MIRRLLIAFVPLVVAVHLSPNTDGAISNAISNPGTRLTPANIKTQSLDFVIHAEKIGALTRFMVSVQHPVAMNPPAMAGYLLLVDGKTKLASCPVAPAKQPKNVVYEFLVNNKHLGQSRFLLEEKGTKNKGVPPADLFWFYLEDFALAKVSSSVEPPLAKP
jgi:hypothetical protein